jgi:hypothetical protein
MLDKAREIVVSMSSRGSSLSLSPDAFLMHFYQRAFTGSFVAKERNTAGRIEPISRCTDVHLSLLAPTISFLIHS